MHRKHAHIVIGDSRMPLCQFPLSSHRGHTCGHVSIASAKRAAADLRKHFVSVRVVAGECPESLR